MESGVCSQLQRQMFTDGDTNPAAIFAVNNNTDTGAFILIIMVVQPSSKQVHVHFLNEVGVSYQLRTIAISGTWEVNASCDRIQVVLFSAISYW